jgi:hypothetical protein
MQSRPFFKTLVSKIGKAFFRRPDQHQRKRLTRREKNFTRWAWKKAFKGIACPQPF